MALRFRQVEVFRCLMASGTTTRAAAALAISQPAVSRHIADLEAHLGFKLFKRHRGRLEPTASAIELARIVEQNFMGLERIEGAARSLRDRGSQPVRVACLPALSTSLLPLAAKRLAARNQSFSLFVDSGTVAEIIERLQNLSADLALTLDFPPILGIEAEPLLTVEHVCALPEGHRLAGKERITPVDFRGEAVVGWSAAGPLAFDEEAALFAEHVDPRKITVTTHTSHTRYAMVAAGLGITIAEPFAAAPWVGKGVVLRRFAPSLALSYSLCYATGRIRSEAVDIVRQAILAAVEDWRAEAAILPETAEGDGH